MHACPEARVDSATISGFCDTAETMSLHLLKAIDETVDALAAEQRSIAGLISVSHMIRESLRACAHKEQIDPEGEVLEKLENAETSMQKYVVVLEKNKSAAYADPELHDPHEGDVVREYDLTVGLLKEFHDAFVDMRWALLEHDANLTRDTASFDNAEDAIVHLRKL